MPATEERTGPEVSVVVASHGRPDRLKTLLDSLAEQTFPSDAWELIVVHTYPADVAGSLLDDHALGRSGVLHDIPVDPSVRRPSVQRNIGWRAARAGRIVFVDDDCRATPEWLTRLVNTSRESPGAIVQGATRPDPREEHLFERPHVRTLHIEPPSREAQTCNILYERALLERIGGFDERATTGEDIDLSIRAREAGAELIADADALVYHGVDALSLIEKIRSQHKWQHLAYVVKRHPELRSWCKWGVWWKEEHYGAVLALIALAGARRTPLALVGAVPYIDIERLRHGRGKRQQLRAIREIPGHWVIELAEVATFIRGSLRYRTLLL